MTLSVEILVDPLGFDVYVDSSGPRRQPLQDGVRGYLRGFWLHLHQTDMLDIVRAVRIFDPEATVRIYEHEKDSSQ